MSPTNTQLSKLTLTQGQQDAIAELELTYNISLHRPEYNIFALVIGPKGAGVNTAVAELGRGLEIPVVHQPATSWIPTGARTEPHTLTLFESTLAQGIRILLIDQIDQFRKPKGDNGWHNASTVEILNLLNGNWARRLKGKASDNIKNSFIVLAGHGSSDNPSWRPGADFVEYDDQPARCIPEAINNQLPKPIIVDAPTPEDWRKILQASGLSSAALAVSVTEASNQEKGLYWLRAFWIERLKDMGLPDLKAVLAQRQAPAPESTPAAAREEKEEGRKALITRQLGVYPEIEVALRYIREADQRHSDLASSERSDPFCAEYTAVNFGSEFFDVLKIPLAFYGLPNKRASRTADSIKLLDAYVNRLTKELQRQIKAKGKKSISADLRHALQTMPPAVYRLPKEYEVPTCLFPILYEHPYYVFLALLESAPDREMETLLCGHPEYAYHLLTRCPKLLTRSLGEAITATASDPFWSLKWLNQNYAEAAYDFMMDHSYQLQGASSADAHFYQWIRTKYGQPSDLPKLLDLLAQTPSVAIAAAVQHPEVNVTPLSKEVQSNPMWTYNWLRLVKRCRTPEMVDTLVACPPWAIQYIEDVKPDDADEILERVKGQPCSRFWRPWLDAYLFKREHSDQSQSTI